MGQAEENPNVRNLNLGPAAGALGLHEPQVIRAPFDRAPHRYAYWKGGFNNTSSVWLRNDGSVRVEVCGSLDGLARGKYGFAPEVVGGDPTQISYQLIAHRVRLDDAAGSNYCQDYDRGVESHGHAVVLAA